MCSNKNFKKKRSKEQNTPSRFVKKSYIWGRKPLITYIMGLFQSLGNVLQAVLRCFGIGGRSQNTVALNGVIYRLNDDGTCAVADCEASQDVKKLSFPSIIDNGEKSYTVAEIGDYAFRNCPALTTVTLPGTVARIGWYAFDECPALTNIVVDANNPNYLSCDGLVLNKTKTELIAFPPGLKSVVFPESVTSIGDGAFPGCSLLTSIAIPDGVTNIGWYAFHECASLVSITIPDSVVNIGEGAFSGCSSLTSITLPKGVKSIEDMTFCECTALSSVIIPDGVTSIGDNAFMSCSSLTSIIIPESLTSIAEDAFYDCPATIKYLGTPPSEQG